MALDGFGVFAVSTALATESTRDNSLDGINTIVLKSGAFGWTQTGAAARRLFRLDREDNTTPPNGTTIIQPLTGPGRWKEFGNGGAVCLLPLFRTIYVDGNTTALAADQNGSISCPHSTIQAALDTIPALSGADPAAILADARQGFVVMIAPGLYDEQITMPQIGRMIILRATGGFAKPVFVPIGTPSGLGPIEGPPVRIEGAVAEVIMDYSFLTEVSTETSICPYYQFEGLFIAAVDIFGDADADIMSGCIQSYRDCWVLDILDEKVTTAFTGQYDFRDTFVAQIDSGAAGMLVERSHFGDVIEIGRAQGADSLFDSLTEVDLSAPSLNPGVMLQNCIVTTLYEASGDSPVQHDAVTEYFSSLLGSSSPLEPRRIQGVIGNGYWKLYTATFAGATIAMLPDASFALLVNPNASSRTFTLPGLSGGGGLDYSHPSAGQTAVPVATNQMSRVIMVKNSITSDASGDVLLDPSSATTIEGAATRVLAPGESLILLGDGVADNWEILASFP